MIIDSPIVTGSFLAREEITGSNGLITQDLTVLGTLYATVDGTSSYAQTASYVEYEDVANKPTLVSSSIQIAADITGSFTVVSESLAERLTVATASIEFNSASIAALQYFSTSLDNNYATDVELNTSSSTLQTNIDNVSASLALSITQATSSIADLTAKTLVSSSIQIASDISGSFTSLSESIALRFTDDEASISSLNAASSSYLKNTTDTLTGDLTVTGRITAEEFHTEFVSSSIIYRSGSTKFGDSLDDVHQFTGSVYISGSGTFRNTGPAYFLEGSVGIGTASPAAKLDVRAGSGYIRLGSFNDDYHVKIEQGDQLNFRNGANPAVGYIQYTGPGDTLIGRNLYVQANSSGGSSGVVRINSDGNVGIGTTSPSAKLHIKTDGTSNTTKVIIDNDDAIVRLGDSGTNGPHGFQFGYDTNVGVDGMSIYYRTGPEYIAFEDSMGVSGNKLVVITRTGAVGVGTDAPAAILDIQGTGTLLNIETAASREFYFDTTNPDHLKKNQNLALSADPSNVHSNTIISFLIDGSEKAYLDGEGLNIKTGNNPYLILDDTGNGGGGAAGGFIRWKNTAGNSAFIGIDDVDVTNSDLVITNNPNNISGVRGGIDAAAVADPSNIIIEPKNNTILNPLSGSVGIGTTSPASRLHIASPDPASDFNLIDFRNPSYGIFAKTNSISARGNTLEFMATDYNSGGTVLTRDLLTLRPEGNVGIGTTSPGSKLTINGGVNSVWAYSTATTDQPGFVAADNTDYSTHTNLLYNKIYGSGISASAFGVSLGNWAVAASDGSSNNGLLVGTFSNKPVIIGTNSAARMTITNTGNVGIGTTSPGQLLDVRGTVYSSVSSGYNFLADKTSGAAIGISGATGTTNYIILQGSNSTNPDLQIYAGGSERMRIQSDGLVGISTGTPRSLLHVARRGNINGGTMLIGDGESATNKWSYLAGAHYDQATGSGNGVGSAGIALIGSYADSGNNNVYIGGGPYEINAATKILFHTHTSNLSTLGGSPRMVIDSNGSVGIGTTSPAAPLHVDGSWLLDGISGGHFENYTYGAQLDISELTTGGWARANRIKTSDSAGSIFFGAYGGTTTLGYGYWSVGDATGSGTNYNSTNSIVLMRSGNVGIGTLSPTYKLDVDSVSGARIKVATGGYNWLNLVSGFTGNISVGLNDSGGSGALGVYQYNSTGNYVRSAINLSSDGNVGIGSTSPSYKLDVAGDIRATTNLFLGYSGGDPKIDMMYNDHASGAGWDTRIFIGKTNNLPNGSSFPTSVAAGGYGIQFQANSDGVFFGLEEYTTGHFRPFISWGDDTSDDPFSIRFNNNSIVEITYNGTIRADGDIIAYYSSDKRLKDNLTPIKNATEKLKSISGYEFDWNDKQVDYKGHDIGVIAQEVEKVLPEVVTTRDNGYKAVKYEKLVALLIQSNKELISQNEQMLERIQALESKLNK